MSMPTEPTLRAKEWLAAYLGVARRNATEAARLVGCKNPGASGSGFKRRLAEEIEKAGLPPTTPIADANEVKEFHTLVMRDPNASVKDRLVAAQTLARIEGLLNDRVEIKTNRVEAMRDFFELMAAMNKTIPASGNAPFTPVDSNADEPASGVMKHTIN